MTHFATEFPQKTLANPAAFVARVVTWLRGATYSTVLDDVGEIDLDGDAPVVRARTGEELRLRSLKENGVVQAIGFRHDNPDSDGRLWRTEAVLRRGASLDGQDLIRLRTQCIALATGARLETPKKPYFLKMLLLDGWGRTDGLFKVSDQPIWLDDDQSGLLLAQEATAGTASNYLPVIYVSATDRSKWTLSREQIEQLAYDLGGVAHVVVEPSRSFSFDLRDATTARNVYNGTVGVAIPKRGFMRRFFIGEYVSDARDLQTTLRDFGIAVRSQMPAEGWDWTELQEQALRQHRARDRNRLSEGEVSALYEEEIATLKDQIAQLKDQIAQSSFVAGPDPHEVQPPIIGPPRMVPEIYPGELSDRLRAAVKNVLAQAERDGLDSRSEWVLQRFALAAPSAGLIELVEDIGRSVKDPRRMADQLTHLLSRHGYREKSRNKHVVLEPQTGFGGLVGLTIPTTPSDDRGLKNMQKQVERALGLTKLVD